VTMRWGSAADRPDQGMTRPIAEPVDRRLIAELRRHAPAPDFTRPVMGRLGYMRAAELVARRRRRRRTLSRVAMGVTMLVLVGLSVRLHSFAPSARQPGGVTIPDAVSNDMQLHQQRLDSTIRMIRSLAPAAVGAEAEPAEAKPNPPTQSDEPIDEEVDRSGIGPVRWL
jgi:hypothetical protein